MGVGCEQLVASKIGKGGIFIKSWKKIRISVSKDRVEHYKRMKWPDSGAEV